MFGDGAREIRSTLEGVGSEIRWTARMMMVLAQMVVGCIVPRRAGNIEEEPLPSDESSCYRCS